MKPLVLLLLVLTPACSSLRTPEGRINWDAVVTESELIQGDLEAALLISSDDLELSQDLSRILASTNQVLQALREIRDTGNESNLEDALQSLELLVADQLEKADDTREALALFTVSRAIARLRLRMTAVE